MTVAIGSAPSAPLAPLSPRARARTLSILFVGSLGRSSRGAMVLRALRELGHDVRAASAETLDQRGERLYHRDPLWRVLARIGRPPDRVALNRSVRHLLESSAFDLLWVSKSLSLRPETLELARRLHPGLRLAFHSEDDMFARRNQSVWFRRALPLYDVVFTHKSYNAQPSELPALGARRVVMVDKCFDRRVHRPLPQSAGDREELGGEVGFAGTFERERADALLELAERGIAVRVWGSHWDGWRERHELLRVEERALDAEEYVRAVNATDVNLGFLRRASRDLQTDRSIEIPACGALLLAERTHEHRRLFVEGAEADFFSGTDELALRVRHWLAHPEERRRVARAGRERCLAGGYSFHDRLAHMLPIAAGDAP